MRQGVRVYAALWIAVDAASDATPYYVKVQTGDGQTICSEVFDRSSRPLAAPVPSIVKAGQCPPSSPSPGGQLRHR